MKLYEYAVIVNALGTKRRQVFADWIQAYNLHMSENTAYWALALQELNDAELAVHQITITDMVEVGE